MPEKPKGKGRLNGKAEEMDAKQAAFAALAARTLEEATAALKQAQTANHTEVNSGRRPHSNRLGSGSSALP